MSTKFEFFFKLFLLISLVSLISCEWEGSDDENYVEIERPPESISLGVDLAGVNADDIIYITNGSYINYTIHSGGRELVEQKFFLDGIELTQIGWNSDGGHTVYIDGQKVDDKIHELKLVMALRTNSGSLAELSNLEHYIGEFTFRLKFYESKGNSQLNIRQSLDQNNHLKLEWDKPEGFDIDRYELYDGPWWHSETPIATINDVNNPYFVDKDYYYGYKAYSIRAIPKNSINISDIVEDFSVDYKIFNQDHIKTSISNREITVDWKNPNPYPVKYIVSIPLGGDNNEIFEVEGNHLTLPRPYFPYLRGGIIYILPPNGYIEDLNSYPSADFNLSDKTYAGEAVQLQFFDKKTNFLIGLSDDKFYARDFFNNLSIRKTGMLPHNIHIGYYFWEDKYSITKEGKVAIEGSEYNGGNIHVFKDCNFTERLYTFENLAPNKFCISDSHIFYTDIYKQKIYAMDMAKKEIVDQKDFKEMNSYEMQIEISSDGKTLILYSKNYTDSWYTIYEFSDNKLQEVRHVRDRVESVLFNPLDESQMILHEYYNRFHIIDIVSGGRIKTMENNRFLYLDPFSHNILCHTISKDDKNGFISVYDDTFSNLLYKVESTSDYYTDKNSLILVNNILLKDNNYLDLSDVIKK